MKKIKCKKCERILAVVKDGWVKITGNTDYSSNGTDSYIRCRKCSTLNKIK
jgi:phage FluMu protein Com